MKICLAYYQLSSVIILCTHLHNNAQTKHRAFLHAISCHAGLENYYKIYCAEVYV